MRSMIKYLVFVVFCITHAQTPQTIFKESDFTESKFVEFEQHKTIPSEVRKQALIALSFYPELKNTKIIFRLKKKKTPLTSRPRIGSIFNSKKKRVYVITISKQSIDYLTPILFTNLPFNAQIGVLGHELAHITQYQNMSSFSLLGLGIKMLNSSYVDQFEFATDFATIKSGLGYQLHDWSAYVRKGLNIKEWGGATNPKPKERYMSPTTILKFMKKIEIYQ